MEVERKKGKKRPSLNCMRHPDRSAAIVCHINRAFCKECMETAELRCGYCGYCPHKAKCPIQILYIVKETEN